jgi:hypothetical protein
MASLSLSRLAGKVVGYPPLSELSDHQRREFHEALLEAAALRICLGSGRPRSTRRSVEPENADTPIKKMLAKLPEGNYRIAGPALMAPRLGPAAPRADRMPASVPTLSTSRRSTPSR